MYYVYIYVHIHKRVTAELKKTTANVHPTTIVLKSYYYRLKNENLSGLQGKTCSKN